MSGEIPVGSGEFTLADPRPVPKRELTVHTYRPASFTPASPILIVMHGRNRDGANYRNQWMELADRHGFLVAVPEFTEAQYAHPHDYNMGAMTREDGTFRPREDWIFPVVDHVFDAVRERSGSTRNRFFLFGHSAGAQVVHRLVTFGWSPRIERAIAANAGSYVMPVADEAFPFGFGGVPQDDAALRALFSRPLLVLLGDQDNDENHYQLPNEPGARRQGPHRFARGHRYVEVARREAERLGVRCEWQLAVAPGIAHSGAGMAPFAARHFFEALPVS